MLLYSKKLGRAQDVPDGLVDDLLRSGDYLEETSEQRRTRNKREVMGELGMEAGVLGAARGLTFGLSDVLLTKTGVASPQALAALQEANPTISRVSEIGGAVAPVLFSGGAGAIGQGLRGAGAAVRGVSALGAAAEGAVARAVGAEAAKSIAAKIATRALAKGAGSMVEGAFYGAGHLVSEAALGREELTAESIASHVGLSALVGGGVGAGLGVLTEVKPYAVDLAAAAVKKAKGVLGKATAGVASLPVKAYGQVAGAVSGSGDDLAAALAKPFTEEGAAVRAKFAMTPAKRNTLAREFRESLVDTIKTVDEVSYTSKLGMRPKEIRKLLGDIPAEQAYSDAVDVVGKFRETTARMRAEPDIYSPGITRKMEVLADGLEKRLSEKPMASAADVFELIDESKRILNDNIGAYRKDPSSAIKDAIGEAKSMYREMASHLENESIYGQAGARQASYNEALSRFITAKDELHKQIGRKYLRHGVSKFRIDPVKVNTYMNQIGSDRGQAKDLAVREFLESSDGLLSQIDETSKVAGEIDVSEARSLLGNVTKRRDVAHDSLQELSKIRALDWGLASLELAEDSGVLSRAVQKGVSALSPYSVVKKLAAIESVVGKVSKSLDDAIDSLAKPRGAPGVIRRAAGKVLEGAEKITEHAAVSDAGSVAKAIVPLSLKILHTSSYGAERTKDQEDRASAYKSRSKELAELATKPELLIERIEKNFGSVSSAAPRTATHLGGIAQRAVNFLHTRAPKPPVAVGTMDPMRGADKWEPTGVELGKWGRYVAAVERPLDAIRDIQDGTFDPEAAEVLREVYPHLRDALIKRIAAKHGDISKNISYTQRNAISQLLGVPFDALQTFEFTSLMQQQGQINEAAAAAEQSGGGAVGPTVGGLSKLGVAGRSRTATERVLGR